MKRILVIDDDEDLLEMFNIIFREAGFNVVTANHSDTANRIWEIGPDLVILDVRLKNSPESGADICQRIKKRFGIAKIPVLLVSAETDVSQIAFNCGADGFVKKPFDIPSLLREIQKMIN
ncbi:response regulator transcription factor [Mucilaginibacter sp. 21P]|uniref:response regulator transcription factor n=1 Tax=Mucilaginibacter sp. 21P TaxID=2778902 RepID=UPI001C58AD56|nr:response regulator [Mucilaginibacter sp. 21P]QXV66772.1 response regulator transcription factor [Mucilaginibacter sp. 21P]